MFICLDCEKIFIEPKIWTDTHGLDSPPYESYASCPYCGGAFAVAYECNCCEKWITGAYIKTDNGERYCENCIIHYELGEE